MHEPEDGRTREEAENGCCLLRSKRREEPDVCRKGRRYVHTVTEQLSNHQLAEACVWLVVEVQSTYDYAYDRSGYWTDRRYIPLENIYDLSTAGQ